MKNVKSKATNKAIHKSKHVSQLVVTLTLAKKWL
jgi:hypothetical protein